jgi:hypothetical protein
MRLARPAAARRTGFQPSVEPDPWKKTMVWLAPLGEKVMFPTTKAEVVL